MSTVAMELPWYRESAFRAWVKGTLSDLALATGAVIGMFQTDGEKARSMWWIPLALAGGNAVKNFLQAAYDIFWASPDTYQAPPAEAQKK